MLHNHCLGFLLGRLYYPGEIENNGYAIFFEGGGGGVNKVHYGLSESGECTCFHNLINTCHVLLLYMELALKCMSTCGRISVYRLNLYSTYLNNLSAESWMNVEPSFGQLATKWLLLTFVFIFISFFCLCCFFFPRRHIVWWISKTFVTYN